MRKNSIIIFILFLIFFRELQSYEIKLRYTYQPIYNYFEVDEKNIQKPKVALCLSGGGARGLSQIGVIRALEESKIPVSYISGASIGALIGGFYSSGLNSSEIQGVFSRENINWKTLVFPDPRENKYHYYQRDIENKYLVSFRFNKKGIQKMQGISYGQKIIELIFNNTIQSNIASQYNFDLLPIPLRVVATDLIHGQEKKFKKGFVHDAVFSSLAIPTIIFPYQLDSTLYVDGGIVNNIPVDALSEFDYDFMITINSVSPLRKENEIENFFDIFDQITTITALEKNKNQLEKSDFLVTPNLQNISSSDFDKIDEIIDSGYYYTKKNILDIQHKYNELLFDHLPDTQFYIQNVVFEGNTSIIKLFNLEQYRGKVHINKIYSLLVELFELGHYEDVSANYLPEQKTLNLKLKLSEVIDSIKISSVVNLPIYKELENSLRYFCRSRYSVTTVKKIIDFINYTLKQNGFALNHVKEYQFSNQTLKIIINQLAIDSIKFVGAELVPKKQIRKRISIKEKEIFNLIKMNQSINSIFSTGLYFRVTYRIVNKGNNLIDIIIFLDEKPLGVIKFGYQYNNYERLLGFVQIGFDYFDYLKNSVYFTGVFGKRNSVQLTLQNNEFLSTNLGFRIQYQICDQKRFFYNGGKKYNYQQTSENLSISFSGNYIKLIGVSYLSFNYLEYLNYRSDFYPKDIREQHFSFWKIGNIIDTRNHLLYPSQGFLFHWNVAYSDSYIFQNKKFFQTELVNQFNFKLHEKVAYQSNVEIGFSKFDLPYYLEFPVSEKSYFPLFGKDQFFSKGKLIVSNQLRFTLNSFKSDLFRKELFFIPGITFYSDINSFDDLFRKKQNKKVCFYASLLQSTYLGEIKLTFTFNSEFEKRFLIFLGADF